MRRRGSLATALLAVVAVQSLCTLFFVWDIAVSVIGLRRDPLSWQVRELIEIGAAVGLMLGVGLGAALLARTLRHNRAMESQLRQVSGAFAEMLEERFGEWGLTPSERDVAWFTIKGLSIADIARFRGTSEGTVKAHSNAIYRKAKVSGRTQLLSIFIEDLMDEGPQASGADAAKVEQTAPRRTASIPRSTRFDAGPQDEEGPVTPSNRRSH